MIMTAYSIPAAMTESPENAALGHEEEYPKTMDNDQQIPQSTSQSQAEGAFVRETPRPEPSDPTTHDVSPPLSSLSRKSPVSSFSSSVLDAILSSPSLTGHEEECPATMDVHEQQQLPQSASQCQAGNTEGAFPRDTPRPDPSDPTTHDVSTPLSSLSRKSPVSSLNSSVLDTILSSPSLTDYEEKYPKDTDEQGSSQSTSQSQTGGTVLKEPPLGVQDIDGYIRALGLEDMGEDYTLEDSEVEHINDLAAIPSRPRFTSKRREASSSVRKIPSFKVEDVQEYLKKFEDEEDADQHSPKET